MSLNKLIKIADYYNVKYSFNKSSSYHLEDESFSESVDDLDSGFGFLRFELISHFNNAFYKLMNEMSEENKEQAIKIVRKTMDEYEGTDLLQRRIIEPMLSNYLMFDKGLDSLDAERIIVEAAKKLYRKLL